MVALNRVAAGKRPHRPRPRPVARLIPCLVVALLWALASALGLLATPAVAASLDAQLERNPIRANETVRLILSIEGRAGGETPSLVPLREDFDVLETSTNTQVRFEAGRQSATTRWIVELAPRRAGTLTVPALALGNLRSAPITLEVLPAAAAGETRDEVFLETELEPERPYVQSQLTLTVRLFRAVDLLEGATLTEPEPQGALVDRLGTDLAYTAEHAGHHYRVLERRYAIFPQKSGTLRVAPLEFVGEIVEPGQAGSFSGLFARGRRVRLATRAFEIEVRPRPAQSQGATWLPATDLQIEEVWPDDASAAQVGTPITRTVRILARGLRGDQLPAIALAAPPGLRAYPDQPATRTGTDRDAVRGEREQRVALIPERPGEMVLPEIRVPWWDIERDAEAYAVLPARTIAVSAGARPAVPATAPTPSPDLAPPREGDAAPAPAAALRLWQTVSVALALVWLLTLAAWLRARGDGTRRQAAPPAQTRPGTAGAKQALREACARDDARAARDALLAWVGSVWPDRAPGSLGALATALEDEALRAGIRELDRALYAPSAGPWRGEALGREVARLVPPRDAGPRGDRSDLPDLYPERASPSTSPSA
jgi:hypothetical protein